jgi:colanic acid biosynthesis glycosyl transferase WcaI
MMGSRSYVIVSQRFPPEKGGNASRIHDTAVNLADESTSVTVLSPPPCYPPGNFERTWRRSQTRRVDGVVVRRLWAWQPARENPGLVRRLAYYLTFALHAALWLVVAYRRYDAVVTSTPPITTGIPGLVAAALGRPWVVDVRDLWIDNSVALGYVDGDSLLVEASRRFQNLVLHTADRVTVTTETLGEAVVDSYGSELAERIRHVPNGVDTARFAPSSTDGGGTGRQTDEGRTDRHTDGGDAGRQVVVYTGNIGSAQALEPCIRAMAHVPPERALLRLVGDGDERSRLEDLTARLGLEDRVEFVGLVDREEVPRIIDGAAVGLAPLWDTEELAYAMPTKVYEYLACRVPVLVTGRGEVRRFVADSCGGVHADPEPEAVADTLDRLLSDPERRERMAAAGREFVVERYDREAIADRLRAELAALCEGRDPRQAAPGASDD